MDLCTYHRIHANSAKSIKVAKQVYSADLPGFAALKPKKSGRTQQRATAWGNTNYGRKNHNRTLFDYQCYKFTTGDHGAAQRQKGLAEAVDEKAEQRRRVYAAFKEADEKEAREKSEVDQVKNERKQRLKKKFHKRACFEEKQKQKQREKDEKHFRKIVDGYVMLALVFDGGVDVVVLVIAAVLGVADVLVVGVSDVIAMWWLLLFLLLLLVVLFLSLLFCCCVYVCCCCCGCHHC